MSTAISVTIATATRITATATNTAGVTVATHIQSRS